MKIEVWLLTRSRQAKRKKIRDNKNDLTFNKGIYLMNREAINFYSKGGKPKGVECFFYEGNPAPIKVDEASKDTSLNFLDQFLYESVIEQTGEIPRERIKGAFNFLRDNVTFGSVIRWGLLLLIIGAMVGGYLDLW